MGVCIACLGKDEMDYMVYMDHEDSLEVTTFGPRIYHRHKLSTVGVTYYILVEN